MATLTTTMFDDAVFDNANYEFDLDLNQYVNVNVPSQQWKRQAQTSWVRKP